MRAGRLPIVWRSVGTRPDTVARANDIDQNFWFRRGMVHGCMIHDLDKADGSRRTALSTTEGHKHKRKRHNMNSSSKYGNVLRTTQSRG